MKNSFLRNLAASIALVAVVAAPAMAVKTNFNGQTLKNAYTLPINAADLLCTEVAADVGNGNKFPVANGGVLLIHNTGVSPYTFTLATQADAHGRTGDITAYSLAAGELHAIWIPPTGVEQSSGADAGSVYVAGSNAAIKFTYLAEPANARNR